MSNETAAGPTPASKPGWYAATAKYGQPDSRKAIWQLVSTGLPLASLWALMLHLLRQGYSYWITLALAVAAGGLLVRLFILFHDCCHGSFFASRRANAIVGGLLGVLTFTPFAEWRRLHAAHHAAAGDLDRRGQGDIWTMTVTEYQGASRWKRLAYRIVRQPFLMCAVGPAIVFLGIQRFPYPGARKQERLGVMLTNLGIAVMVAAFALNIGIEAFLLIQVPILIVAGAIGIWLFYVQHQFEGVYWARHQTWEPIRAALEGSSYYKLPKVLQWVTASIGLHHIHHVRARIPNYRLQQCFDEIPALHAVHPLTLRGSLKSLRLNLWDERQQKLVSFRAARAAGRPGPAA